MVQWRWLVLVAAFAVLAAVASGVPAAADEGDRYVAAAAASEGEVPDDPATVVPPGANQTDGPGGLGRAAPAGTVDGLNPELGRAGWASEAGEYVVAGKSAERAVVGPVAVDVPAAALGAGTRVSVEVLPEDLASQVSVFGAAAAIDFVGDAGGRVAPVGPVRVELDLADAPVLAGAEALERARLVWFTDCAVKGGELTCDSAHVLDVEAGSTPRVVAGVVDVDALAAARRARVDEMVERGVPREVAEAPVLPPGHTRRERVDEDPDPDDVGGGDPGGGEPAEAADALGEVTGAGDGEATATEGDEVAEGGLGEAVEGGVGELEAAEPAGLDAGEASGGSLSGGGGPGGFGVLALTSGPSGPSGDFSASPYAPLEDFQVGLFTGAAELAYPIPVPAASAGPVPGVSLGYSSAAVDGLHAWRNVQVGPVGAGWSLTDAAVTRSTPGGCETGADADSCFSEVYSLSLNGRSSRLEWMRDKTYTLQHAPDGSMYGSAPAVQVDEYRLVSEALWRVLRFQSHAGTGHPDPLQEWWLVVTPDGVRYEFGRDATAVDWVPLYYDSVEYSTLPAGCDHQSYRLCTRAYRWNLEKVIDRFDNQVRYRYGQELNWYRAQDDAFFEDYVRSSRLLDVTYTFNPSVAAQTDPNARVVFNWEWRCGPTESFTSCDDASSYPAQFLDTPTDLVCRTPDSSCPVSNTSPTFFTELRLGSIATQVWQSTGSPSGSQRRWDEYRSWDTVATFDLRQAMPDPDDYTWFQGFTDEGNSGAKTTLMSVYQREGGAYEKYGYGQIEAEFYDADSGLSDWDTYSVDDEDVGGGYAAGWFNDGDWARYDRVLFGDAASDARVGYLRVFSLHPGSLSVQDGSGTELKRVTVDTGESWETVSFTLDNNTLYGVEDIKLVAIDDVSDGSPTNIKVNWLRFATYQSSASDWFEIPSQDPTEFTVGSNLFEWLPNRVNSSGAVSPMVTARIKRVTNPLGGYADFTYDQPVGLRCGGTVWGTAFTQPDARTNTTLCYPAYDPYTGGGGWVWWHKWVVTKATWDGPYADNDARIEDYDYGTPAWALGDDQASLADPDLCSNLWWNVNRGFDDVTVTYRSSAGDVYGKTRTSFFQGMHGDPSSEPCDASPSKTVTRTYGSGVTTNDFYWRRGEVMQVETMDPAGVVLSRRENRWNQIAKMQGQGATAGSMYERRYSYVDGVRDYLLDGTSEKVTGVNYTHEPAWTTAGRLWYVLETTVADWGEEGVADSRTIYRVFNPAIEKWILGKVTDVDVVAASPPATSPLVSRTEYVYSSEGVVTQAKAYHTATDRLVTTYGLDTQGRVETVTAPGSQTTTSLFDPVHGYVTSVTNPAGHVSQFGYDHLGRLDSVTDPNGAVTEAAYDGLSRVTDVWLPGDPSSGPASTEYVYGEASGVKQIRSRSLFDKSPLRYIESVDWLDGFGRVTQTDVVSPADPANRTIRNVKYDGWGHAGYVSGPVERAGEAIGSTPVDLTWSTVMSWQRSFLDPLGRPDRVEQRSQGSTLWTTSYDYDAWTTTVTDPNGNITESTMDAFGNVVDVTEFNGAVGSSTSYEYDGASNLVEVTDPAGNVTTIGYDLLGRKTSMTDPDMGAWSYTWDDRSNLSTQDGPRSNDDLWFGYDMLDRQEEIRRTSSTGVLLGRSTWDSDAGVTVLGQRMKTESFTTAGALSTTRSWTYDARYRVTEERFDVVDSSGGVAKMAVGYGFGDGGQVTSVAYPAGTGGYTTGEVVTYEHDPVTGALTGAVSDTTSFKVDSVGYDYAGRMLSTLYGDTNGTREERAYEQSTGRLRYVYGGGAPSNSYYQHQRFFYDPGGNVTAVFDLRNPVAWASRQTLCYEYDDLDRLTRAYTQQTGSWPTNGPDCTGTPSMTAAGDTAEPGTGYDRTYTYGQAGNVTAVSESYNDPTTAGDDRFTLTYTYPVAGQARPHAVTSVTDTSGPNWSFGYDQAGNMTTRVVDPASQALTYDPQNRLATVTDTGDVTTFGYDLDGNRLRTTTTGGGDRLYAGQWWETTMSGGGEVTYYWFNDAMVAYADTTGAVDYLFTDHLGSVTTTHGASGTLNNRYHPFGEPRDTLQVIDTDHGYTGQRRDTTTGLMYYQARYYDPTLRRFTQPDTIIPNALNPQDLNRYTYTRNNPVKYTDPSGHKVIGSDSSGCMGTSNCTISSAVRQPDGGWLITERTIDKSGGDDGGVEQFDTNAPIDFGTGSDVNEVVLIGLEIAAGDAADAVHCADGFGWNWNTAVDCGLAVAPFVSRGLLNGFGAGLKKLFGGPADEIATNTPIRRPGPGTPHADDFADGLRRYIPSGAAAGYDLDELAQLTYQHVGAGDIPGRPSFDQIRRALDTEPQQIVGQNAVRFEYEGVTVIVNEDLPTRSTAFFPGS